jgi:hypothetical protein
MLPLSRGGKWQQQAGGQSKQRQTHHGLGAFLSNCDWRPRAEAAINRRQVYRICRPSSSPGIS